MADNGLQWFRRHSIRLVNYDYSSPGAYFVTVVTLHRECVFGEISDGEMRLNQYGRMVKQAWEWLPTYYPYVYQETCMVMPNHFHGILQIIEPDDDWGGGPRPAPTGTTKIKPLGQLIGAFKTISAKQINLTRSTPGLAVWQRNYYEHVIRNQDELEHISVYILGNPQSWADDPENRHNPCLAVGNLP
jgi:REP-associated tyrosine transposase